MNTALASITAAVLVAGGMVASATVAPKVPQADGTYIACYSKSGSVKFLLKDKKVCPKGWKGPVTWNQVGPQGPQGPQGPKGEPGTAAAKGDKGEPGADGVGSSIKIADANGVEIPGSFFAAGVSILRDGYVWRVQSNGKVTGAGAESASYLFSDPECTVLVPKTMVWNEGENGISNLAAYYEGKYYAVSVSNKSAYGPSYPDNICTLVTTELWELGAELKKPADFVGPVVVAAR